ncbi:hypothetical protein LUZ60_004893 [Juncus effusus]|nr:hypothetical protein LUZ60_004893 [Juncus effusus]
MSKHLFMRPVQQMADHETGSSAGTEKGEGEEEGDGEGTSHTKDWLQLGLGPSTRQRQGDEFNQPYRDSTIFGHPVMPARTQLVMTRPPFPWALSVWNNGSFIRSGMSGGPVNPVYQPEMRVMVPPAVRPHTGVWFVLQASPNQEREPFLPQIPKSYLRIKDGRATIRLLIKYLINKLGMVDESEVEIMCRGRILLPLLTIQQVRDNIWCSREAASQLPQNYSSAPDHIMILLYSRKL